MDLEACRRLKGEDPDKNINSMRCKFAMKVYKSLDGNPATCNWEAFLAIASELRPWYNRSLTDIAILSNHRGSISQKLLWDLGSSGMVIHELVFILDRLRLENILIDIKEYEPIEILIDLERTVTVDEGYPLVLAVEGMGFPYPRYQWFKAVDGQWSKLRTETGQNFIIEATRQSDSGLYCCRIFNGNQRCHGKSSSTAHVHVTPRPMDSVIMCSAAANFDMSSMRQAVENTESTDIMPKAICSVQENQKPEFVARAKVAILIGNDHPEEPLHGVPEADVKLMTTTLENLDFKVFSFINLSKSEIYEAISILTTFINSIGTGVYVMFCYFGHGFEEARKCYLVPSDTVSGYGSVDCVCADDLLDDLQYKTKSALIVMALDTCRKRYLSKRHKQEDKAKFTEDSQLRKHGNTVVLYSTSKGMSAYQDKQHGLLVKYFNRRIQQQSDVIDVMKEVLSDMRIEMNQHDIEQIPQFTSTLNEKRSFRDPVSGGELLSDIFNKWRCVFEPPPSRDFFVPSANLKMRVEFEPKTLNSMYMRLIIGKMKELNDIDLTGLVPSAKPVCNVKILNYKKYHNSHEFEVMDIQKLEEDLIVKLCLRDDKLEVLLEEINLHRPLIAAVDVNFWKNRL